MSSLFPERQSSLCILDVMEGLDPHTSPRKVIGIDIDIRENNRKAIESHPLSFKIKMIEGSSIDSDIVETVKSNISKDDKVLVSFDSNHTEEHVYAELDAYSDLVTVGSYSGPPSPLPGGGGDAQSKAPPQSADPPVEVVVVGARVLCRST